MVILRLVMILLVHYVISIPAPGQVLGTPSLVLQDIPHQHQKLLENIKLSRNLPFSLQLSESYLQKSSQSVFKLAERRLGVDLLPISDRLLRDNLLDFASDELLLKLVSSAYQVTDVFIALNKATTRIGYKKMEPFININVKELKLTFTYLNVVLRDILQLASSKIVSTPKNLMFEKAVGDIETLVLTLNQMVAALGVHPS